MQKSKQEEKPPYVIILLLIIFTVIAFADVFTSGFINYDDPDYVTENIHVREGITPQTIKWAFTTTLQANWHPLTWLSLAFDYSLFGLNATSFHAMNFLFHLLSSIFLFFIFERMTHSRWQSAFVAFVFALHPLHVESVAWISERKDVLSGFFGILTIGAYIVFRQSSNKKYYFLMLAFFILGLMAKPMLVTLPFVLLLLDYWPLNRFAIGTSKTHRKPNSRQLFQQSVIEKIPLFLFSAASSIVTFLVQQQGKAMLFGETLPFQKRIVNAIVSYAQYVGKAIYPTNLSIFYPHQGKTLSSIEVGIAIVVLALITYFAWKQKVQRPYLLIGWLWFLGTLVPVIGIVQIGMQGLADRYMYLPIIGLAIMVAWGVPSFLKTWRNSRQFIIASFAIVVLCMIVGTRLYASKWKDTTSLFSHALSVTSNNYIAHDCLGTELADSGKHTEAARHLREAVRIMPTYTYSKSKLGAILLSQGNIDEAISYFLLCLRDMPDNVSTNNNLGVAFAAKGQLEKAATYWNRAIEIDPENADAHSNLARLYSIQGKTEKAIQAFETVLRLDANHVQAHYNYGNLLATTGKTQDAKFHYSEALRITPGFQDARTALRKLEDK
ncbi:MAG: tetratricopeptide repeat protein [Ignavibacteriae bacterium]|nr:tetratricopeptide repeat protein [Ignavibacteriota bacterium]